MTGHLRITQKPHKWALSLFYAGETRMRLTLKGSKDFK